MTSEERREQNQYLRRRHLCIDCRQQDERTLKGRVRCEKCAERCKKEAKAYRARKAEEKEEAKRAICEDYCRYPREWDENAEETTLEDGMCAMCPLNKL